MRTTKGKQVPAEDPGEEKVADDKEEEDDERGRDEVGGDNFAEEEAEQVFDAEGGALSYA